MNYNFEKDLKDGKKGEQVIRHFVESTLGQRYIKDNDTNAFDLLFEDENLDLVTYEVKTDLWVIETEKLRDLLLSEKFPTKTVGETHYDSDDKVSKCYMIPRFEYKEHFDIYTFDGERWLKELEA